MFSQGRQQVEEVCRQRVNMQTEKIFHLRQENQHCNAVGKTNDDRHGNEANQHAQAQHTHEQQPHTREQRRQHQTGHTVLADDAVNDDDESTGRSADLHLAATHCRNEKPRDDGGEQPCFRL